MYVLAVLIVLIVPSAVRDARGARLTAVPALVAAVGSLVITATVPAAVPAAVLAALALRVRTGVGASRLRDGRRLLGRGGMCLTVANAGRPAGAPWRFADTTSVGSIANA